MSARRKYLSLAEAAEYLGVTDRTIRNLIARGQLTGYRIGPRLIRVSLEEIEDRLVTVVPTGWGDAA